MTHSIIGATARHTRPVSMERRLAAILSADVQGYSRLMYEDETATIRTLTAYRGLMGSLIRQYRGRVVDDPGDNLLAEFPSVLEAVQCAVTIQRTLAARNAVLPPHRQMVFRMGLHLGDIVVERERIYGAAVNLAARLERVADGGGLCISGTVYDHVVARPPSVGSCIACTSTACCSTCASLTTLMPGRNKNCCQCAMSFGAWPWLASWAAHSRARMDTPSTGKPLVRRMASPTWTPALVTRRSRLTSPSMCPERIGRSRPTVISVCPPTRVMPNA